jgi:nucleoside-diphosphate-sugar epimerase
VLAAAGRGVRASVVRLPPSVHGTGDHGFVPALIDIARRTGISAFVAEGANRWPAVHRLDAARLYRLALEKAVPGARLHGVAEEGVPLRAIAQTIGTGLGVPVRGLAEDEARKHFDWFARFVAIDNPSSTLSTAKRWDGIPRSRTS